MPTDVTQAGRRFASLTRHRGPDHPDTLAAARDFRVEQAEAAIERLVSNAPPLTAEQLARLGALLFSRPVEAGSESVPAA